MLEQAGIWEVPAAAQQALALHCVLLDRHSLHGGFASLAGSLFCCQAIPGVGFAYL